MTGAALALTAGIIAAIAVIVVMACIVVGAAADPLSRFDRTDELTSDAQPKGSVSENIEGQQSNHIGSIA